MGNLSVPESVHQSTGFRWRTIWLRPKTGLLAVISLALLAWVLWLANLNDVWKSILSADYRLIALSLPILLVGLMLRAARWRILLSPLGKPKIFISFNSMMVGYLGNNLLPARGGELIRVYALGRQTTISKSAALATIVVERIGDSLIMLAALSFVMIVLPVPPWVRQVVVIGAVILLTIISILIAISNGRERVVAIFDLLISRLAKRWQPRSISLFNNFINGLTSFRNTRSVLLFVIMTLIVWSMDILWFYLVLHAFGIFLCISSVVLLVTAGTLSTIIPALPGYVGTYHFVLVNLLMFSGVMADQAVGGTLVLHGIPWLVNSFTGILCAMRIGINPGQAYSRAAAIPSPIDDSIVSDKE